ncbi:MAG: hypothetical protein ACK5HR_06305, partial [Mycoplasmatales bacterium]
KTIVGVIVDEITEGTITMDDIKVLPYENYYGNMPSSVTYLEETMGFSSEIWDLENIKPGTSEPIKLK